MCNDLFRPTVDGICVFGLVIDDASMFWEFVQTMDDLTCCDFFRSVVISK